MFVQVMIHGGKVGLTKGLYFQKRKYIEKHFLNLSLKNHLLRFDPCVQILNYSKYDPQTETWVFREVYISVLVW